MFQFPKMGLMGVGQASSQPLTVDLLFAGGVEGVWFDPSDLSTIFQESTGLTPVTAAADPVGLMLDKSKGAPGVRRNQLSYTEDLSNDAWLKTNATVTQIDGAVWELNEGTATGEHIVTQQALNTFEAFGHGVEVQLKAGGGLLRVTSRNIYNTSFITINTETGATVDTNSHFLTSPTFVNQDLGDGWHFVGLHCAGVTNNVSGRPLRIVMLSAGGDLSYEGTSRTVRVRRPRVNLGNVISPYQKITTGLAGEWTPGNHASNATSAQRPLYQITPQRLVFDKVDDRLLVTIPTGGWTGSMAIQHGEFPAIYEVNIPAGSYDIGARGGLYLPGTGLRQQIILDRTMTAGEKVGVLSIFGNGVPSGNVTSFWRGWSELTAFPLLDFSSVTSVFAAWFNCGGLTSFPLLDFSAVTNASNAWYNCAGLTSFPLLDFSAVKNAAAAWRGCAGLTEFPLLDFSAVTSASYAWFQCTGLTSFPLLDFSAVTNASYTWRGCTGLTEFPLLSFGAVTDASRAWFGCTGLTSFPLLDFSAVTNTAAAWYQCTGLTSFPLLDFSAVTDASIAWYQCTGLTAFPAIVFPSTTNHERSWDGCTSLATFPPNLFDTSPCTDYTNAFRDTALTEASIDNILVSINTAGTSNGKFTQSGGTAPSVAKGRPAIDALRARDWDVTVTGGY